MKSGGSYEFRDGERHRVEETPDAPPATDQVETGIAGATDTTEDGQTARPRKRKD
jgi:hypothetical protein